MAEEKSRVEQYRDLIRQAQEVRWNPDIPHDADWQNRIDDLNGRAAKLGRQMTPDEREEFGLRHMPKEKPRREPDATRSSNIKKLLVAGAILGAGVAANRALSK